MKLKSPVVFRLKCLPKVRLVAVADPGTKHGCRHCALNKSGYSYLKACRATNCYEIILIREAHWKGVTLTAERLHNKKEN